MEHRILERTAQLNDKVDELNKTRQELIQSEKMAALGQLVAGVAHEINTPVGVGLSAISFLETEAKNFTKSYKDGTMKRTDLDGFLANVNESSGMILYNLERAIGLIKSFKQVAVDQTTEELRTFNVKSYMEEIIISLRPKINQTQHKIVVNGDVNLEITSYPGALSQIMTNLIINSLLHAYDANEVGNLTIDFNLQSDKLILQYQDDGKGIPPESIDKIFDPFFTTARSKGGTGLGLHIVYNLVTQTLNGKISVTSQINQYTVFTLEIPTKYEHT